MPKNFIDYSDIDITNSRYSLDSFDTEWLRIYNAEYIQARSQVNGIHSAHQNLSSRNNSKNQTRPSILNEPLSEDVFEAIIDEFEESMMQYFVSNHLSNIVECQPFSNAPCYEETICQICYSHISEEENPIVICDGCDVSVHQFCYGLETIPSGPWLCGPCSYNHLKPLCFLCGNDLNGAFTMKKSKEIIWAHNICALWIPEVYFDDTEHCKFVKLMPGCSKRRFHKCYICGLSDTGFCIECDHDGCNRWFHVSCAFASNLRMICKVGEGSNMIREVILITLVLVLTYVFRLNLNVLNTMVYY